MDEKDILDSIGRYVSDEQKLRERYQRGELSGAEENRRLERIELALDQCWDLLRQRRARLAAGEDPDLATPRPPDEVEGYLQ
ncbi:DUF2630 family protein [Spirillospora sp. CA-294931]|uniref:DUF2630 family protein n=1 Tax=Spirillospora sp. CA-294931 TaxID=3240042 RepID=UPI003D8F276E